MRIDRATFLAFTATLSACHDAETPRAGAAPAFVPPPLADAAPSEADAGAAMRDTGSEPGVPSGSLLDYVDRLSDAGLCEAQRFGPRPPGAEGHPVILDALATECGPLEYTGYPVSCSEGAFGCTTVVNTLQPEAARRVLACLRAKRGTAICARGVVQECTLKAIAGARPRADLVGACARAADACQEKGESLARAECERFLSATRKCHGVQRMLACLPEKCDVRACLDDWISTWSY